MPRHGGVGGVPTKGAKEDVTMGGTQRNTKDVAIRGRGRPRGRGGAVSRGRMRSGRKVEVDEDSEVEEDDEGDDGDEPYIPAPNTRALAKKRGGAPKGARRPRKQKKVAEDDAEEEKQNDSNEEDPHLLISDLKSRPKKTTTTSLLNTPAKSSETDEPTSDPAPAPGPYKYPRPEPRPLPPPHTRQHAPPSPRAATGYYVSRRPPLSYSPPPPSGDPRNYDPRNSEPAVVEESRDQGEEQQQQEVSQNSRNYPEGESVKPKKKHTLEDEFKLCAQKGKAYAELAMGGVIKKEEMGDGIGIDVGVGVGVGVDVGNGGPSRRRAKVGVVKYREFERDEVEGVGGDADMEDAIEEEETRRDGDYNPIPSNTSDANTNSNNRPPTRLGLQTQNSPPRHSTRSRSTPPPIPPNFHNHLSTEIARVTQLMNAPFSTLSATEQAERRNRQTTHKKLGSKQNGVGFGMISPHDTWHHFFNLDDWICVEKIDGDGEDGNEVEGVEGGVNDRQKAEGVVRWRVWAEERVPRPENPKLRDPKEITQYRS